MTALQAAEERLRDYVTDETPQVNPEKFYEKFHRLVTDIIAAARSTPEGGWPF